MNPSSTPTWRNESTLQQYHFLGFSSVCPADFSPSLLEHCFAIKTLPVFGNPTQIHGRLNNTSGCLTVSMVNFRPPARFYLPITAVTTDPAGFFLLGPWRELKHTSVLCDCTGLISFSSDAESCVVKSDMKTTCLSSLLQHWLQKCHFFRWTKIRFFSGRLWRVKGSIMNIMSFSW